MEVEETIKRIQSHKGVKGVLIMNNEGHAIRSNFSPEDTENYASLVSQVSIVFTLVAAITHEVFSYYSYSYSYGPVSLMSL